MRVLIVGQGHPAASGDARDALAYDHFRALGAQPAIDAVFLHGADDSPVASAEGIRRVAHGEFALAHRSPEPFHCSNLDVGLRDRLRRFVTWYEPDIIHLFDFHRLGVEIIETIRADFPAIRFFLSFSGFDILCQHDGSMVKRRSYAPCSQASPKDCQLCFPNIRQEDFLLRALYQKRFGQCADRIVVRSETARRLLAAHGFGKDRIAVFRKDSPDPGLSLPVPGQDLLIDLPALSAGLGAADMLERTIARLKERALPASILIDISASLDSRIALLARQSTRDEPASGEQPRAIHFITAKAEGRRPASHATLIAGGWSVDTAIAIEQALARGRWIICGERVAALEGLQAGRNCWTFADANPEALATLLASAAARRLPVPPSNASDAPPADSVCTIEDLYRC